jgi:hypothetical protein
MRTQLFGWAIVAALLVSSNVDARRSRPARAPQVPRVMRLTAGKGVVTASSADGRWGAQTGRSPGVVRVYDLRRRSLARKLAFSERRSSARYRLRFSPRGRYLVVAAHDGSELREHTAGDRLLAWRLRDGKQVLSQRFPLARPGTDSPVGASQPLHGLRVIASGKGRVAVVALFREQLSSYELVVDKQRASVHVGGSLDQWPTFAVSPDGQQIAGLTRYHTSVGLYSPWTGKLIKRLPLPPCRKPSGLCGNGAMTIVLTRHALFVSNGNGAIWSRRDWKRLAVIDDQRDVSGGKLEADYRVEGERVFLRSKRGKLIRWDLTTGRRSVGPLPKRR